MKRLLFLLSFLLFAVCSQAQFRLAVNGTPSWTNLGGGLYSATVTFHSDLTGNSYAVAGIVDTMRLFTSRGQVFEVDSVWGKTFSQATLRVEYVEGLNSAPAGQGMVYAPGANGFIPDAPFGSTGATAQFNQMTVTYNATKSVAPPFDSTDIAAGGIGNTDLAAGIVTASKIANDAVTLAKQASGTANRLQGFDASGNPSEMTVSGIASLASGNLAVTEVDGSTTNELTEFTASSGAPGSPKQGDLWHDTDGDTVFVRDGGAWVFLAIRAGGSSGRDSMYIASPDTLVHKNTYGNVQKVKMVYTLPADSLAVSGSTLNFYRRGSGTPLAVTLPNPTPAIVSQTATTNTTVTLTTGEVYEVNLSGVSTCNITWASLTSGKQHKIHFQNGSATTLNLPTNTVFLKADGGQCLINPVINKEFALIEGYTNSSTFYVTNSTVPLTCVSINAQYQAVLDYALAQGITKPSLANQLAQSRLVDSLQANGIWDSLDIFYNFYTSSVADSNFTKINWKDPGGDDNITANGGRTFTALDGWASNGTTGYLNTNFNPTTEGVAYSANHASFGCWVTALVASGSKFNMGLSSIRLEESSSAKKYQIHNGDQTTSSGSAGFWHVNRSGSTTTNCYNNGTSVHSGTLADTGFGSANMFVMGLNLSGSVFNPTASTVKYRFAFMGGNLASKASVFYTILNAHVALIN